MIGSAAPKDSSLRSAGTRSAIACCSASIPAAAARLAVMRRSSTTSPVINSDACEAATAVWPARSRTVAHSACQDPSGRSSTLVPAARCRVEASGGPVSAARRISTESTGLCFCGMVDEPPPPPSASSAISGRDSVATSAAIRPYASVQPTRASPTAVTMLREVCHGTAGASPSALATDSTSRHDTCAGSGNPQRRARSVDAASVPAVPLSCTILVDRDADKAVALATRLAARFPAARLEASQADELPVLIPAADGLVHYTPTGMADHPGFPLDPDAAACRTVGGRHRYRPLETALLHAARASGFTRMGRGMGCWS